MKNPLKEKIKRALYPHLYKKDYFPLGINLKLQKLGEQEREKMIQRVFRVVVRHFKP